MPERLSLRVPAMKSIDSLGAIITPVSPESSEAIHQKNNHILADMFATVDPTGTKNDYHVKQDVVIRFYSVTASFELLYPKALLELPITNLKKFFTQMVKDYRNSEAINYTALFLEALRLMKIEVWAYRSKAVTDGYRDEKWCPSTELKSVKANNKKLINALKRAKADYEKSEKLETFFNQLKEKYQWSVDMSE